METACFLGNPDTYTSKNIHLLKRLRNWNVEGKMFTLEILKKPCLHTFNSLLIFLLELDAKRNIKNR